MHSKPTRRLLAAATSIAFIGALGGCSEFTAFSGDSPSPEPTVATVFGSKAEPVVTKHYDYAPGVNVEGIFQTSGPSTSRLTSFTITATEPTEFFYPGSYYVDPKKVTPATRKFVQAVKEYSSDIVEGMDQTHYTLRVQATYTGMADSPLIRSNLVYLGQFGAIDDKFPVNGKTLEITLKRDDRVTANLELADLRAHCIQYILQYFLPAAITRDMINKYNIDVSRGPGAEYRYAKVHVELVPRSPTS